MAGNPSRLDEARLSRREHEQKVQSGEWPIQVTSVPLFPFQREGMLHLAFTERDEQIQRFTGLPLQLVFGAQHQHLKTYANASFFTVVNYELMVADALDVNNLLKPDVVVLDEARRIKNWNTKTAQAIKRLKRRYAFVLTGTLLENRIDEIHSHMDFLNPEILGPLCRFNCDFYQLDDRGRPAGYKNLDQLHQWIKPLMPATQKDRCRKRTACAHRSQSFRQDERSANGFL